MKEHRWWNNIIISYLNEAHETIPEIPRRIKDKQKQRQPWFFKNNVTRKKKMKKIKEKLQRKKNNQWIRFINFLLIFKTPLFPDNWKSKKPSYIDNWKITIISPSNINRELTSCSLKHFAIYFKPDNSKILTEIEVIPIFIHSLKRLFPNINDNEEIKKSIKN